MIFATSLRRGRFRQFGPFPSRDYACEYACWLLDLGYKEVTVEELE